MGEPGIWVRVAAVALLAAGCSGPPSPPQKPTVSEIELVPSNVAVASNAIQPTNFLLETRLWSGPANDRESIVPSAGIPLTWTVTPPGAWHLETTPGSYFAKVVFEPGAAPTAPIEVKVEAEGLSATSQIMPSAISGDDPISAAYAGGLVPDAVVARGIRTPADKPCAVWLAPGLVRTGLAGKVTDMCVVPEPPWGVALLGQEHGMEMYPVTWNSAANPSSPPATTPVRVMPVATRVFITGGNLSTRQTDAANFAKGEIDDANSVFRDNRVGIKLDVVDASTVTGPNTPGFETDITDCALGDKITRGSDHLPITEAMLHIYLVDGTGGSADAFTCGASDSRPYPVIYLAVGRSGTILLHEVGHALGLDLPGAGHTDDIPGFDPADVMAGGYADSDDVWRRRLTVGQILRMNADAGSWLTWATNIGGTAFLPTTASRLACQCGYQDPLGRCPRLSDDVAHKRGGLGGLQAWDCGDQIWMDPFDFGENPLALVAGREWRTALSECPQFFTGYRLDHDGRMYIQLGKATQQVNLTRPGSCQAWAVIFFENHRPVFRSNAAMDGAWSVAADTRYARDVLSPMSTVAVHVWYDIKDDGLIPAALAGTEQVYGKVNRGGLVFAWTTHKTLPGTCPSDIAGPAIEYQVCWSSTSGPTIPQLLGQKWGLHLLTAAELSNAVYAGNVMHPTAPGNKLTLGQLFHVHAALKTPGFDCSTPTSDCPPLEADAVP